jgi:maltooligosyltrehalose trehalohydrolase
MAIIERSWSLSNQERGALIGWITARSFPTPLHAFSPRVSTARQNSLGLGSWAWQDTGRAGLPGEEYVLYEVHVGTFTGEGGFRVVIPRLEYLAELGVTAVELMLVAQFPGGRNWGYDGASPFAVQNTYGSPADLRQLVDAAHQRGLAVVPDVVYHHLGPEGNYLDEYAPYFTERYRTPWDPALNFDGPYSDKVRRFLIENALYWLQEFHVDALRLDPIHGIVDTSACPFLAELAAAVPDWRDGHGGTST